MTPPLRPAADIHPAEEDQDLFQTEVVQIDVLMSPLSMETDRGDLLLSGRLLKSREFEVAICGRRAKAAAGMRAELALRWGQAMRAAARRGAGQPDPYSVRLPVTMEGAWRMQMRRDDSGWETRHFRFVAARWTFIRACGDIDVAGEMPLILAQSAKHAVHEQSRGPAMPNDLSLTL